MPENERIEYLVINKSEEQFESAIEDAFLNENGFFKLEPREYNKKESLFTETLLAFIKSTQPKEWGRYEKFYGPSAPEKLFRRIQSSIDTNGILWVLKNGIKDMGISLRLCYFKPESTLNGDLNALYSKNIFGVTRQFRYSQINDNEIDIVLSLNGFPLFAFELKNQLTGQDYQCGIRQWQNDRDPKEYCFHFDKRFLAYFAVDLTEAWVTTQLKKGDTKFLPFNQGSNGAGESGGAGNPENPDGYMTDYLWKRVFTKDSMMDLLNRFIVRVKESYDVIEDGKAKKVTEEKILFPRFHQYDVTNKILEDVKSNGAGKNYLIDHSAGSGKSNSIAWVAYRLASAFDLNDNPIFSSVIVVTNRIVLDSQLQDTINSFEHKPGLVECITQRKGSRGLVEAINDRRKIIICTVQKFLYAYKDFDDIKDRNFAIIIDEAHQGQSGESARTLRKSLTDMGYELRKYSEENEEEEIEESDLLEEILAQGQHKNQSFFAFTATPLPKTIAVFGTPSKKGMKPYHTYSMRQAIEEGFILDVLENYTTIKQAFRLVKDFEENPLLIEGKTKKALVEFAQLHDFTIDQKVKMIMTTFLANGRKKIGGKGKAMVVASSRLQALKYYHAIKKYIEDNPEDCVGCGVLVAFSGQLDDPNNPGTKVTEAEINVDAEGRFINNDKKFRAAFRSDNFNIMVVANKYQTGYDEPLLHSMYVDKKLKGVSAVQTLSRLNRTCKGKEDTFVLDFENTAESIKNSFQDFYQGVELEGEVDINTVYDMRESIRRAAIYSMEQVDSFCNVMEKSSGKKQTPTTIGRLVSILKPSLDKYKDIEEDKDRLGLRQQLMQFVRRYGFVTNICRIDDKELFKEYLFVSYLVHMLPKTAVERVTIEDKIRLQYFKLEEEYSGQIALEKQDTGFTPANPKKTISRIKKKDTLERIIEKVNLENEGRFGEGDKVAVESVYKMLMDDEVVKTRLQEFAKTSDIGMFINSIFPSEFQRVLVKCFMESDEAYQRLLGDEAFQKLVMDTMAKEFYKRLTSPNEEQ